MAQSRHHLVLIADECQMIIPSQGDHPYVVD